MKEPHEQSDRSEIIDAVKRNEQDLISRAKVIEILEQFNIPGKLIELITKL